jgi:hypothetical protein
MAKRNAETSIYGFAGFVFVTEMRGPGCLRGCCTVRFPCFSVSLRAPSGYIQNSEKTTTKSVPPPHKIEVACIGPYKTKPSRLVFGKLCQWWKSLVPYHATSISNQTERVVSISRVLVCLLCLYTDAQFMKHKNLPSIVLSVFRGTSAHSPPFPVYRAIDSAVSPHLQK